MSRPLPPGQDPILYDNAAEQAVLAAILLDQGTQALRTATALLHSRMFYLERHRVLYEAMQHLAARNVPIDPVTLRAELDRQLEQVGGMEYLGALIDVVPTTANIRYHAEIVREKAFRRDIARIGATIQDMAGRV